MFLKLILASTASSSLPRKALFTLVVDSRPIWQMMHRLESSARKLPSASLPPRLTVLPLGKVTDLIAYRSGQASSVWQVEHRKPWLEAADPSRVLTVVPVEVTPIEPPFLMNVGRPSAVWHFTQPNG